MKKALRSPIERVQGIFENHRSTGDPGKEVVEALVDRSKRGVGIERRYFGICISVEAVIYLATLNEDVMGQRCNNAFWDDHLCKQQAYPWKNGQYCISYMQGQPNSKPKKIAFLGLH